MRCASITIYRNQLFNIIFALNKMPVSGTSPIYPTQGSLALTQGRLECARRGHNLLKKKTDGLVTRFRKVLVQLLEAKSRIGEVMKEAMFSLAAVKYAAGDINQFVLEAVDKARIKVRSKHESISGVKLQIYECYEDGTDSYAYAGLARGGQQVVRLKKNYRVAIELLVQLASLQYSVVVLNDIIKTTNRRVNALRHIVIPQLHTTVKYIANELDEYEREEFYRMKKVLDKKKNAKTKQKNTHDITHIKDFTSSLVSDVDEDILF